LQRNNIAATRLNLQHYQFQLAIGWLLHPAVPMKPHMHVADLAAGTVIWPLDLIDHVLADAILEGWDISNEQFPFADSLPWNATL
ncbi:hypothetical protein CC78DRAFT_410600, partial [Lojkania enalia]